MKDLAPVAKPSPIAATSPRLMRTTSTHLLHLGSAALTRQGVQNRLTAELTPNDQPAPARRCLMEGRPTFRYYRGTGGSGRSVVPRPRVWVRRGGFVHRVKCQSGYPWAQSSWKLTPDRRAATCGAVQREGSAQRFDTVPEPGET